MPRKITRKTIKARFDEYQNALSIIKSNFSDAMIGELQYIQKNNGNKICVSFFPEDIDLVEKCHVDDFLSSLYLSEKRLNKLRIIIKDDEKLNEPQKRFIIRSVDNACYYMNLFKSAVWIEAEKGGYILDDEDREKYHKGVLECEDFLYGPRISDDISERRDVSNHLVQKFVCNQDKLSEDENNDFIYMLRKIGIDYDNVKNDQVCAIIEKERKEKTYSSEVLADIFVKVLAIYGFNSVKINENNSVDIEYKDKETGEYHIPVTMNTDNKRKFFQKYGIDKAPKVILSDRVNNVSVNRDFQLGYTYINVPMGNSYTFERIARLIDHEIGTHFIREENAAQGISIRSPGYLETEEGIAKTNEDLVVKDIESLARDMDLGISHIYTFFGENFDRDNVLRYIYIYNKLNGEKTEEAIKSSLARIDRVKRFHPNNIPGANRKDVVYLRGQKNIVKYLKDSDPEMLRNIVDNIYLGKFSYSDIDDISSLFDGFDTRGNDMIKPLALGKLLMMMKNGIKTSSTEAQNDPRFLISPQELDDNQEEKLLQIFRDMDG